jgi:nucleoporin p58/p45
MKAELENIDKMIQQQESFCRQIEAILPKHGQDLISLTPDSDFIRDKVDAVEQALTSDAHGVDAQRRVAEKDGRDLERCGRIITNLGLPQGYQFANLGYAGGDANGANRGNPTKGGNNSNGAQSSSNNPNDSSSDDPSSSNYDTDLIRNYFLPLATSLQSSMSSYTSNLVEIEAHMRVIESSALAQAQQLAQRKSGAQAGGAGDDGSSGFGSGGVDATVRELADTLRGFEASILGVAGAVGECREGVNELVLGKFGGAGAGRY